MVGTAVLAFASSDAVDEVSDSVDARGKPRKEAHVRPREWKEKSDDGLVQQLN